VAALGEEATKVIRTLTPETVTARLDAVRAYALALPAANGKLGSVGFCWGGGTSFDYATRRPKLDAAVVFYGSGRDGANLKASEKAWPAMLALFRERLK
jgi:carboxymethylenebutenolidase